MTIPLKPIVLNPLGLHLDRFLYAQVGEDQQGGALSVISALARVGVDPWDEAASLALLPQDSAVRALSSLLARLPAGSGQPANPVPVATRLVMLLPRGEQRPATLLRTATSSSIFASPNYRLMALACAIFFLLLMVTQLLMQHRGASDTEPLVTPASPATVTAPPGPLPITP